MPLLGLAMAPAENCPCQGPVFLSPGFTVSRIVFKGEAVAQLPLGFDQGDQSALTIFRVRQVWKGQAPTFLPVLQERYPLCGSKFELGREYLVFTIKPEWALLPETRCSMPNQDFDPQIASGLGQGWAPIPILPVLFLLLLALIVMIVLRKRVIRTRSR